MKTKKQENKTEIAKRFLTGTIEMRAEAGDEFQAESNILIGYASVFGIEAEIGGYFREKIQKGAFSRAINESQDVRALVDHEPSKILGRTKAKTLSLREDEKGLAVEIQLPDTTLAKDIRESIKRGDISQMSIGFIVRQEEWDYKQEVPLRTISDVDLFDVSVVTYPAFEDTEISLRNAQEAFKESKESQPLKKGFPKILRVKLDLLDKARRH